MPPFAYIYHERENGYNGKNRKPNGTLCVIRSKATSDSGASLGIPGVALYAPGEPRPCENGQSASDCITDRTDSVLEFDPFGVRMPGCRDAGVFSLLSLLSITVRPIHQFSLSSRLVPTSGLEYRFRHNKHRRSARKWQQWYRRHRPDWQP